MNNHTFVISLAVSGILILAAINTAPMAYAGNHIPEIDLAREQVINLAPVVISGDNVYVTWFTNESTVNSNFEVGFRASTDGGATFGPITNLSNSDNVDSINTEISAEGENVIVSWWERNQTANVPVARVSTDGGETFGARLNITANGFGTIGSAEEG